MAYVRGEEKITKTVESPEVAKAYGMIHKMMPRTDEPGLVPWGSTRFDSHGYVMSIVRKGILNLSIWRVQRACPSLEFRFHVSNNVFCVMFRTKGSTGWHY
jgi:hypothetical protein